ncbi:hypothetical protein MMC27_000949 [Xylographa pallens]|nr:hypothetical protein [Xylographa pallens]
MSSSPIEDSFTTSYKYIDLMEKGQAFPADLIHPETCLEITENCREVRQASTQILSTSRTSVVGGPRPMLHRRTSALGLGLLTTTAEPLLPNTNTDDNSNDNGNHTVEDGQRISASADYRAFIATMFNTLYPGCIADYHAQNSFNLPNHENLQEDSRGPAPFPGTVDWPSPTVSEFLRVASPSTSWIDIDEYSDGHSSTSASQEEELPDIPDLFLGSPLVPAPPCGLFNVHEGGRVVKAPFYHRIPARAPSFGHLECGWDRPDPRGKYLRTLGSNGHVKYIPFSPVAKIQYAEPELLTSEDLVALNQNSPVVLCVRRAKTRKYQKSVQHRAEPRCNDLSGLEAVRSWCNAVDTTLPPPGLPTLTRSELGANLARLRSRIVRLRSDMADKQLWQANKPEHFASEHGNIVQSTAPPTDSGFGHPSLRGENATLGPICSSTVHRPPRMELTTEDRRFDAAGVDEEFRIDSLLQSPNYDRDKSELENSSFDEMCHPCYMGSTPPKHPAPDVKPGRDFHIESLLESPAYDCRSIEIGDASIDAAYHPCHAEFTPEDIFGDSIIHNGSSQLKSLPQIPGLTSDIIELGHADIGRVYRSRRVGLTPDGHRREGIVFDQDLYGETLSQSLVTSQQNTELPNASIHDEPASTYGTEPHWADYIFHSKSPGAKAHDLVLPAPRSRNAQVANLMKHNDTQPSLVRPEDSMLSVNTTGTVVVHRLRRRHGMMFDVSMKSQSHNVSSDSSTLRDVPLDSPADAARIAYNHELTLAMLEGRVKNKEFGSPIGQIEHPETYCRNGALLPSPDTRSGEAPMLCAPVRTASAPLAHLYGMNRRAKSFPIEAATHSLQARRHGFEARRRLGGQWVDEIPYEASAIPSANKIPINASTARNLDETMPKMSSHSLPKPRTSPKTWLKEKAKRIARIFR